MKAQFTFHPERCTGCGACVMACINENGIDTELQKPYRLPKKNEYTEAGRLVGITYFVHGCMHCPEHPCVEACKSACFTVDRATGTVVLNSAGCVGCRKCSRVCPYEAIQFIGKRAAKCSGCRLRLATDRLPLCVLACPRGAITVNEKNKVVTDGLAALKAELAEFRRREEDENGKGI